MKRIDFLEFYQACKDKLTFEQLRELNPYALYHLLDGAYLGLEYYQGLNAVFIWIAVSGPEKNWWRSVFHFFKQQGIDTVYYCSPDKEGTLSFCKYVGGIIEPAQKDGRVICKVDLKSPRMT